MSQILLYSSEIKINSFIHCAFCAYFWRVFQAVTSVFLCLFLACISGCYISLFVPIFGVYFRLLHQSFCAYFWRVFQAVTSVGCVFQAVTSVDWNTSEKERRVLMGFTIRYTSSNITDMFDSFQMVRLNIPLQRPIMIRLHCMPLIKTLHYDKVTLYAPH